MSNLSKQILTLCDPKGGLKTSLGKLQEQLTTRGIGFWIVLIALPSALPIPAPGYSTPLGLLLCWIGCLLFRGKKHIQFPAKWEQKEFSLSPKLIGCGVKMLKIFEFFTHMERFQKLLWVFNYRIIGLDIMILSIIMAMPIPLTNTLPAGIILLFGLGLLENDGLLLLFSQVISILAISLYGFAAFWIYSFGLESFQKLFQ